MSLLTRGLGTAAQLVRGFFGSSAPPPPPRQVGPRVATVSLVAVQTVATTSLVPVLTETVTLEEA